MNLRIPSPNEIEALRAYDAKKIMHPRLDDLTGELGNLLHPVTDECVFVMTGPSGVGKSTVVGSFVRAYQKHHLERMLADPNFVPVVSLRLPAPVAGEFNWKDTFIRLLTAFEEPLVGRKSAGRLHLELDGERITNTTKLVREELRRAVENCVKHRGTLLLIIDEASHLFITKTRDTYLLQFELLKSIANEFNILILLVGAYDLLKIEGFNGQLTRRTRPVHFRRYTVHDLERMDAYGKGFVDIVTSLLDAMPIPHEACLNSRPDYFLMNSLGCTGHLKTWLRRSLQDAYGTGSKMVTAKIVERNRQSNKRLKLMAEENRLGELQLEDIDSQEVASLMGFSVVPTLSGPNPPAMPVERGRQKPGTRNPSKDPVGGLLP